MASTLTIPGAKYVVNGKGQRTGVILPIEKYQQLLEDFHDLSVIAKRKNEKPISLEELKRRLARCLNLSFRGV